MKIVIVAGGTGGHLYPGVAIAQAMPGQEVLFIVRRGDLGREILNKEKFKVREIAGQGLPRVLSSKLLSFPFLFVRGWFEAWSVLRKFRPDWVIGMGGYLSVPVILLAHMMGIKTLLHEQNVYPGLANRCLSRWADSVAISFKAGENYFPRGKTWISGLPIRSDMRARDPSQARQTFGLRDSLPTFLVFGGSLGAKRLNELILQVWAILLNEKFLFQVLHVTGKKSYESIRKSYEGLHVHSVVLPYCHTMAAAYAAADWVICRAGASTVAELLAVKRPATLIPYPFASNNHQLYNAAVLKDLGVAEVVLEKDFVPEIVARYFRETIFDPQKRLAMQNGYGAGSGIPESQGAAQRLSAFLTKRMS